MSHRTARQTPLSPWVERLIHHVALLRLTDFPTVSFGRYQIPIITTIHDHIFRTIQIRYSPYYIGDYTFLNNRLRSDTQGHDQGYQTYSDDHPSLNQEYYGKHGYGKDVINLA